MGKYLRLVLNGTMVALVALSPINCTDPAPAKFTVTFNSNGGTPAVKDKTVEAGKTLRLPKPDPTKQGYTFAGWCKDEELTQAFNFSSDRITANTTLYAKWIATYTVTFNANNGTAATSRFVEHGSTVPVPSPPTKAYHAFAGWYKDKELTQAFNFSSEKISANITLYARWIPHLIKIPDVNFRAKLKQKITDAFVGELLNPNSAKVTSLTTLDVASSGIKDLTGIHYFRRLTKLYCDDNQLTDLSVLNHIQLTVLSCGGNNLADLDVSNHTQLTALYCDNNQLTDLDVSNHTQLTVLSCSDNSLAELDVSGNTQLTALYCDDNQLTDLDMRGVRSVNNQGLSIQQNNEETNVIKTLKVHENLKEDEEVKEVKTVRGDEVTIETYSAAERSTAYTLLCSDYDPTVGSEADRCGDELKYTITFNSNGGSLVNPIYLYYERIVSKPDNPTKEDSLFVGWYRDEGVTKLFEFSSKPITANITLYARWASTVLTKANKDLLSHFDASTGKLTIIQGVDSIGADRAFRKKGIKSIVFPNSLTGIGNKGAFSYNPDLTEVTFPSSLTHIGSFAFENCGLTTVILPNTLTYIEKWAFYGNELAAVTIPNSLTAIEDLTFANNQLTAISIPNSVTSIGKNAFAVNKLAAVTIPNSVTFIDRNAFEANKLTTVTLSNSLTTIESGTFLLNQLTAVIIPNGVTDIKYAAFQENKLTAVTLPNSLTTIEGRAFLSNKLTDVTIPNSVTAIGVSAFWDNQLTAVTIPNSVTAIGDGSFFGNPDLVTVTLAKKLYDSFSSDELIFRFGDRVRTYKTHDGEILKEVVEDNAAP